MTDTAKLIADARAAGEPFSYERLAEIGNYIIEHLSRLKNENCGYSLVENEATVFVPQILDLAESQAKRIAELEAALKPFAEATLLSASTAMGFSEGTYYADERFKTVICSLPGADGSDIAEAFNRARAALAGEKQ